MCRHNNKLQYYLAVCLMLPNVKLPIAGSSTVYVSIPGNGQNATTASNSSSSNTPDSPHIITTGGTSRTRSFVPIFTSDNISYFRSHHSPSPTHRTHVPLTSAPPIDANSNDTGGNYTNRSAAHADPAGATTATYSVYDVVKNFDIQLKNIRNVELGVTIIQEIFDAMNFSTVVRNNTQIVTKFAKRIAQKLERAIATIGQLRTFFRDNMTVTEGDVYLNTIIHPCPPFEDISLEQTYNTKQIQILNYLRNSGHQYDTDDVNFTANAKIMEEMREISGQSRHHLKNVYFLSRSDHASDHNCQYYFNDIHFRYLYVSAVRGKHVFLLIDHGSAFSSEQIELSKTFVTHILNLLSSSDSVTIVTIADRVAPMELPDEGGDSSYVFPVTLDVKAKIFDFINKLNRSAAVTNHTLGFEFSFELLRRQNISVGVPIQVLYVTRGLLSHLTEGLSVLMTISRGQSRLIAPVRINTCAVVLDERRMMYEKQFLRDIAEQNYTKYGINVSAWYSRDVHDIQGNLFVVTKRHLERVIKTSTAVFGNLFKDEYLSEGLQFHLPVVDYNTRDVIVSVTEMVKPFGVVGVNMYLTDLAEDVIYYKGSEDSYAFLIDTNGTVLVHPAFSRPLATLRGHFPVDIFYLEDCDGFREIRRKIVEDVSGNVTLTCGSNKTASTYTWRRVLNAYIVGIVARARGIGRQSVELSRVPVSIRHYHNMEIFSSDLIYHRIDLIPPQNPVCRHFRQIATLDSGTIFLSPSSFQSPFIYMRNNMERDESKIHNAQSIMAYIKDITNLLANPGLQPQVRNDVSALYHVMSYLKKRHQDSGALRKYIIRRYVATTNGVIQIYPGCILGTDLEPSRRPWYRKAMKHPGKIIATEPYLDVGGGGYIVTIAHTVFEGKANALHNAERDTPVAIVAIDVPYAFFYKLLLDSSPLCSEASIKCLLIEDEGYLIAHPSIMEPSTGTRNNRRPLEHITHKESFVANDILNHKSLVRKKVCASYQNRTVHRYYRFNTNLNEVLTNVAHGDRTKYQITVIRGTNLFVALINSTCDGGAFCPCSTVDRTCLNCNRMDQTDCECPCECPLNIPGGNDGAQVNRTNSYKFCEPPTETFSVVNSLSYDWGMGLKSCVSITCDVYTTQMDCLGVMGCEWCQLDIDGNQFATPFCAPQSSCFNGVLGSITPYGDGDVGAAIVEPSVPPAYSAIGPVGGAIIALCLVVGFAMYCYRQNLDSSAEQFYADSIQDDNYGLPLSRFNFDDISPHDDSDLSGGGPMHRNLLQSVVGNAIAVPDISPYHMSSGGYRRPNGESDHGYSTMTPHEDSEHMCFTLVEPLINNKRLSMSDSMSINTSVSSPTNQATIPIDRPQQQPSGKGAHTMEVILTDYIPGQTMLQAVDHHASSPHHILAPVTVHRHMEAS